MGRWVGVWMCVRTRDGESSGEKRRCRLGAGGVGAAATTSGPATDRRKEKAAWILQKIHPSWLATLATFPQAVLSSDKQSKHVVTARLGGRGGGRGSGQD